MEQLKLIEKVKEISLQDDNVTAVLMYGSFTRGEGDQYSDIEFYIFLNNTKHFNSLDWVNRIRPTLMFFSNEYGTEVAVFDNMIRGEFHFHNVTDINIVKSWEGVISFEYAGKMNLVDKTGRLADTLASIKTITPQRNTPDNIQWIAESLINTLIMTGNLIKRGELAHAQNSFYFIRMYTLWLIRLVNHAPGHWESPTKKLEEEIPAEWYTKYSGLIPVLDKESLVSSFESSINLGKELFKILETPAFLYNLLNAIDKPCI